MIQPTARRRLNPSPIEKNNKFVRGRKRAKEDIERYVLSFYNARKRQKEGNEYSLHISYEAAERLDKKIYDFHREAESQADMRNCFIQEADVRSFDDPGRYW